MNTTRTKLIALSRKKILEFFTSTQGEKTYEFEDFAREVRREVIDLDFRSRVGRILNGVIYSQEDLDKDIAIVNEVLASIQKNVFENEEVIESYRVLPIAAPKDYTRKSDTPQIPGPIGDGDYAVLNKSRDDLGWNGWRPPGQRAPTGFWKEHLSKGNRIIALDFNDAGKASARGIEIVVPRGATSDEIALCQEWAKQTQQLLKKYDVTGESLTIRGNGGVRDWHGIRGVFHTEPFFARDKEARAVIALYADEYAQILVSTLGQIKGATFIPPHERRGGRGGAHCPKDGGVGAGLNERDFAKKFIIPAIPIKRRKDQLS